ncbi:competence protein CoiA [Halobacillus mangrovi]|uniref:Competence protein CoiA n=1 Tax=Halobacillus mangrovi TaxID=402384 RepID=A0A1W5ZXN2_9BACI|nr:competence protein CoiA family protein [Halobacillus mangrovi]ARI78020.1 hypothetical protein HM131_14685 [Halobacillus mangrovi]
MSNSVKEGGGGLYYAVNHHGELTSLYQLTMDELRQIKSDTFHCPNCHERLLIRAGPKVAPHFAHFPKSNCVLYKGESVAHEAGKWDLYHWMKRQSYNVELEVYVKEIQQRPDILLTFREKKIALEYQCSAISIKEITKRNQAYLKEGIFPLWILGINHLKQQSHRNFLLNDFLRSFLYYFNDHFHLYFYDPDRKQMIVLSNLHYTGKPFVYGIVNDYPLPSFKFPQLFNSKKSSLKYPLTHSWEKLLYNYRTRYKAKVSSLEYQFRQYVYLNGHHFSLIPSVCYLPVPGQLSLNMKPYIWQTRLLMDHFMKKSVGEIGQFPSIFTPPTINQYQVDVTMQYVNLLDGLGVLKKINQNQWVKKKDIIFHQNMKNALEDDKNLINQLKKFTKNS